MTEILDAIRNFALTTGINLILGLLVLGVGLKACSWASKRLKRSRLSKIDPEAQSFVHSFLGVGMRVMVVIIAVAIMGVPTASIVTLLGSCGVTIGLALQGSLSNFAGGIMLLLFRPFKVGDYILSGDSEGTVEAISVFYTTLVTPNNSVVVIPNATLSNSILENVSARETRRIVLNFVLGKDTPVEEGIAALLELAGENEQVLSDPAPFATFMDYQQGAMEFSLRVWVKKEDYWPVRFDLQNRSKEVFDRRGLKVPTPQLTLTNK